MARRPYQWPATRLDPVVMEALHRCSLASGRPITRLVREAVEDYVATTLREADPTPACSESLPDIDLQVEG